jgi:hypothetical protein
LPHIQGSTVRLESLTYKTLPNPQLAATGWSAANRLFGTERAA